MRIANKSLLRRHRVSVLTVALVAAVGGWQLDLMSSAQAGDPPTPLPQQPALTGLPAPGQMPAMPQAINMPGTTSGGSSTAGIMPPPMRPMGAPPMPSLAGQDSSSGNSEIAKGAAVQEEKVTGDAKNMAKRLDTMSDAMTLQDLNSARQTVARLEAIIDVEKHLSELEKIHNDRNTANNKSSADKLAATIPATALAPPPAMQSFYHPPSVTPTVKNTAPPEKEKPRSIIGGLEIQRISGADGRYSALIKLPDGLTKSFRDGDHINDNATVRWINVTSVLIEENGSTHSLKIKNVDAIYSAMR